MAALHPQPSAHLTLSRRALVLGLLALPSAGWARVQVPPGYRLVGHEAGVPPALLYCVAAQESVMRFGDRSLPYPWTLCARGTPLRFDSYRATVSALQQLLRSGVTNVDCGAMQVNWHWHSARLGTPAQALDPYPNLRVGASLLKEHATQTGSWFQAVGRYHHPSNAERATRYATGVFQRLERLAGAAARGSEVRHG